MTREVRISEVMISEVRTREVGSEVSSEGFGVDTMVNGRILIDRGS